MLEKKKKIVKNFKVYIFFKIFYIVISLFGIGIEFGIEFGSSIGIEFGD